MSCCQGTRWQLRAWPTTWLTSCCLSWRRVWCTRVQTAQWPWTTRCARCWSPFVQPWLPPAARHSWSGCGALLLQPLACLPGATLLLALLAPYEFMACPRLTPCPRLRAGRACLTRWWRRCGWTGMPPHWSSWTQPPWPHTSLTWVRAGGPPACCNSTRLTHQLQLRARCCPFVCLCVPRRQLSAAVACARAAAEALHTATRQVYQLAVLLSPEPASYTPLPHHSSLTTHVGVHLTHSCSGQDASIC